MYSYKKLHGVRCDTCAGTICYEMLTHFKNRVQVSTLWAPPRLVLSLSKGRRLEQGNDRGLDVLIDEDGIAVGIDHQKVGGACCIFVCFGQKLYTLRFQLAL